MEAKKKNKAAQALAKLGWRKLSHEERTQKARNGGLKGGVAAALSMTPEQRAERARKGALKRAENYRLKREAAAQAAKAVQGD
jgi:hypothetical protein